MAVRNSETAASRFQALSRKPRNARRLALIAEPDIVWAALCVLAAAGYDVGNAPATADALQAVLTATEGEAVMLNDYAAFYGALPAELRDAVAAHWGAAEHDPQFHPGQVDCGRFLVPAARFGMVAVIEVPPAAFDPPRHHALARLAWVVDAFRADAVVMQRPSRVALPVPVLTPADGAPDVAALPAALDGESTARRRWRLA